MNALESEILDKFCRLMPDQQRELIKVLETELNDDSRLSTWQTFLEWGNQGRMEQAKRLGEDFAANSIELQHKA